MLSSILLALLLSQSKVDLKTQAKNPDLSAMTHTLPAQVGASLPGTCTAGEMFFLTGALPGQNINLCTASNVWTPVSAVTAGAATATAQLTDFLVAISSNPAVLNIGGSCSTASPCLYAVGDTSYSSVAGAALTILGGYGVVYIYLSPAGVLTAGSLSLTLSCANCAVASVGSFPAGSIPLWTWSSSSGTSWDVHGGSSARAFLRVPSVAAGMGLTATRAGGQLTLGVDPAMVGMLVAVPSSSSASCVTGQWSLDASYHYLCVSTNTWKRVAISTW
jgi:hypothetical protein